MNTTSISDRIRLDKIVLEVGMFRKSLAVLLFWCLIFASACAPATSGEPSSYVNSGSLQISSEDVSAWMPVTVEDSAGNTVTITEKPERIVSLPVWATEMLLDLVDTDRVVGISRYNDAPALSANADKAALVTARVESRNPEGIAELVPDLVILDTFNDYDGSLSKTLSEAGITVLSMVSPVDFDQIKAAVTTISKACGAVEEGSAMVEEIDGILNDVGEKTSVLSAEDKLTVMYYEDYFDQSGASAGMLCAYGPHSPFDAIASAAGLVNVCDLETYSPVDREVVVGTWKPEVLVVPSILYDENFNAYEDNGVTISANIKADTMLSGLPAIENNRIFAIPGKYSNSTSHYMAKAVLELAKTAYPELFD